MNQLAIELNEKIAQVNPHVLEMLSALGRRIYFPVKGILSQSAEAKKLAKRYNASIGTAMELGQAMALDSVMDSLPGWNPSDALLYAPSPGIPELRSAWQEKNLHDNPTLQSYSGSLPVVTNGLSNAISLAADLFVDANDTVLLPDMNWDNYHLNFQDRIGAKLQFWKFFRAGGLDCASFREALTAQVPGSKILCLLNFPNNPSGYTPTESEGQELADALLATAARGVNVIALVDDAYYGLFFEENIMRESLYSKLAGRHPRLLAIKADAATKELYVWGLRIGFLTFSVGGAENNSPLYAALEAKTAGLIRSTISNSSQLSQKIALRALRASDFYEQRAAKAELMGKRAQAVRQTLDSHPEYAEYFVPYPFNSGYFMCLQIKKGDAETLRQKLLQKFGVGTIAITSTNLRIAFSCLEVNEIPDLFQLIYQAAQEIEA